MKLVGDFKDEVFAYACAEQQGIHVEVTNSDYTNIVNVGFYMGEDNIIVPVLRVKEDKSSVSMTTNRMRANSAEKNHECVIDLNKHVASVPLLDVLNYFGDSYQEITAKIKEVTEPQHLDKVLAFKKYVQEQKKQNPIIKPAS